MKRASSILIVIALILLAGCSSEDPQTYIEALQSENAITRLDAAAALGDIGGEEVIAALIDALEDPDPRVARRALLSLVEIGGAAVPQLAAALKGGSRSYPVLEFDPERTAVIEPQFYLKEDLGSENAVLCFFPEVLEKLENNGTLSVVASFSGESGPQNVYTLERDGRSVIVIHPGVGAPLSVTRLERLIAGGVKRIVAVGGAGALREDIGLGDLVLPTESIRDEGTSYQYLPAGAPAVTSESLRERIAAVMDEREIPYQLGMAWTTDAFYRETRERIDRRRDQGALVVEMECAALSAVAMFRGVEFAQILYGADDLSGAEWDHRNWRNAAELREGLFWIAVEAVLAE